MTAKDLLRGKARRLFGLQDVYKYIEENADRMLERLWPLLSQRSISAQGAGMSESARLLAQIMEDVGIKTQILPTSGETMVFGQVDERADTTLLVYGHYDVQPPEPLEQWKSPPFEPTVRDGFIYARGAADNKGQLYAHLMAIEALLATRGRLGCNVKFLFEGEEEVGSPNLAPFIRANKQLLAADACYTSDALQHPEGHPYIFPGLKGMVTMELTCRGANRDRHSAMADIIENPAWRLLHALTSMRDLDGQISVDGFYDDVVPLSRRDRELLAAVPNPKEQLKADLGLQSLRPAAEENFHVARTEPTFNISGLVSGYTDEGMKTVLPHVASAKLDIRLAPKQHPDRIASLVRAHLDKQGFTDVEMEVTGRSIPSMTDVEHPFVELVLEAAREGFGRDPLLYPKVVGSGPDYVFTDILGMPSVIVPYAGSGSEIHAPNENMAVDAIVKGARTSAAVFAHMHAYIAPAKRA